MAALVEDAKIPNHPLRVENYHKRRQQVIQHFN